MLKNLIRRKDPEHFRPGIDPAWWGVPIVIALAVGVLHLLFQWDGKNPWAPGSDAPEQHVGRSNGKDANATEKPDPFLELADELKKGELKKDAAVTQPPLSPFEAAVRQNQKR